MEADEHTEHFIVTDADEQPLAYVYYAEEPSPAQFHKAAHKDEARRIAVNIAKLPQLIALEKRVRARNVGED
jgi:hypothetical protein